MQVTCDHFTIGFVKKNRYFKKQNAGTENQPRVNGADGRPSGLKLGHCTVAEITRATGQVDHLEKSPLRRRDGTCAIQRHQPGSTPGHDSRLYRSGASMVFERRLHSGKRHSLATQQHLLCSYNWFVKNQYLKQFMI